MSISFRSIDRGDSTLNVRTKLDEIEMKTKLLTEETNRQLGHLKVTTCGLPCTDKLTNS